MQRVTDRKANRSTEKSPWKTNNVILIQKTSTKYLYYPLDAEGFTLKDLLLPASAK